MPNRIIKESVCSSESIDRLSWFEECFFYRLMVTCDDYGCFDARPVLLKNRLFPLKETKVKVKEVEDALASLARAGIILMYEVEVRPYLQFTSWPKHQQIRSKRAKFPLPISDDCNGYQMIANVPVIQSNPIRESNPNPNPISAEIEISSAPAVVELPLVDGSLHGISQAEIDKWSAAYPAVDVIVQIRKMSAWLDANPKNKKTRAGINRFVVSWLGRTQDKAPPVRNGSKSGRWEDFQSGTN